jgi:hypothetical protein
VNVTEAHAVQKLLRFLLDPHQSGIQDDGRARRAAQTLAKRSVARLGRGSYDDARVRERWPDMLEGCPGCDQCLRPIEPVPVGEVL